MIKYNPPTAEICVKRCGSLRTTEPCNKAMIIPERLSIRIIYSYKSSKQITSGEEHFSLIYRCVVELMIHKECDGKLQSGVDE